MTQHQLTFDDDGYGSPQTVEVVDGDTLVEIRGHIRDRRWHSDIVSDHDCTGIMFQQTCRLLHVARTDRGYSAVLLVTSFYDV